jgi:hypothetical protein
MEKTEKTDKNSDFEPKKNGGARPGAGRPAGSVSEEKKTILQEQKAMKERIAMNAERLINAQMTLALGTNYLFKITYEGKGKNKKKIVELVEDLYTITAYLNGELEESTSDDEGYFYVTAEKPNAIAIKELLDRAFGKPKEEITLKTKKPLTEVTVNIIHSKHGDSSNSGAGEASTNGEGEEDSLS